MAVACKGVFIVGAKRTPFCNIGGSLRELPAYYPFAAAAKDALYSANLNSTSVDCTIVGNVNFLSQCDGGKTPRYCGIYSRVPVERPALGVNKACGSGLQAVITGVVEILTGSAKVCLTGGTELMSSLPFLVRNVRFGSTLGVSYSLEDHIKKQFPDSYTGYTLQKMAEIAAEKYSITRQMADDFAFKSHMKWKAAETSKVLQKELTRLTVQFKKKEIEVYKDELPESYVDINSFSRAPTLTSEGKVVTSLNSSAPADGAAVLILSDEDTVQRNNLNPLARIVGYVCAGGDPLEPVHGVVCAVRRLLDITKTNLDEIDLFEINENFASQALATIKELKVDEEKVNVCGGSLALGNPVAATGARAAAHLVHQLNRKNGKKAIAASGCGGGQAVAVLLETV